MTDQRTSETQFCDACGMVWPCAPDHPAYGKPCRACGREPVTSDQRGLHPQEADVKRYALEKQEGRIYSPVEQRASNQRPLTPLEREAMARAVKAGQTEVSTVPSEPSEGAHGGGCKIATGMKPWPKEPPTSNPKLVEIVDKAIYEWRAGYSSATESLMWIERERARAADE